MVLSYYGVLLFVIQSTVIIVRKNTKSGDRVVLITNYERRKSKISSNERNKIYLEEQGEFMVTLVLD